MDIFEEVMTMEPLWRSKDRIINKYPSGYVFFDETWSNFHGPYDTIEQCQKELDWYVKQLNTPKNSKNEIEQWIEDIIDKKIKDMNLANKAWVKSLLIEKTLVPTKEQILEKWDDIQKLKEKNKNGNWKDNEVDYIKEYLNKMINNSAMTLGRTNASIKGKLYHILAQSYGKV